MILGWDSESTSLLRDLPISDPSQPRVCQLGLRLYDGQYRLKGRLTTLIRPDGWQVEPEAIAVHGITTQDCLKFGVPIVDALKVFARLTECALWLVGHNIAFDRRLAEIELNRLSATGAWLTKKASRMVCTMETMTPIAKLPGEYGFKFPSLQEAMAFAYPDEPFTTAHDADADVEAAVRLFRWLRTNGHLPA